MAYRTTSRKPTRESSFTLTYGMEAIVPTEIEMPTIRIEIPEEVNAEAITKDLDTTDEIREVAVVRISIIPTEVGKLAQPACKAAYIQSWGVSLKKDL